MTNRNEILQEISSTFAAMQRLMHLNFHRVFEELKIAPSQLQVLLLIEDMQPVNLKDLAAKMRLTPGAITQLIEGLVQEGYVERTPGEHDRRITCVALTAIGATKTATLKQKKEAMFSEVVSTLDDDELQVYLRVQQKMLVRLEAVCINPKTEK